MRRIKNLAAIMLLATMVSLSAPATFAGILMSDRTSTNTPVVTTSDDDSTAQRTVETIIVDFISTGIIVVF